MLVLPLFAMQVSDEVDWSGADFAIFGAMLVGAGGTFELAVRMTGNKAYRSAIGIALAAAFILVWVNGAVGIIGNESNPPNLMYGGVLAVGIVSAVVARFQPHGMARALLATALAQALVAVIAVVAGWGTTFGATGFFVALWLLSALLFRKAALGASSGGRSTSLRAEPAAGKLSASRQVQPSARRGDSTMLRLLCRRELMGCWAALSVAALGHAQAHAQTTVDVAPAGGLALLDVVWVLIPAGALLLPKLLERRLVALMFKRSEAMKPAPNDAAAPSEVDSAAPLEIVQVHSQAEIPGAAAAREHYSARWIALFRKALWCDVGVALAYVVLTGAAMAVTDVVKDLTWIGPFLGVLYLIFALVRYRLYFPRFHTGDGQIGAAVDDMARFAVNAARNAAAGTLGWVMLFVSSLLTLTMPRLRIWMTVVFVLLGLLFASAMFDEGSIAVGSMLVAAAGVHVLVTAWFSRELQRHPGLKLLVLRVFGVDDKATFTFGSVLAVWGFFGNYFTIIDPSYWRHANKLWSIATLVRVLGTLALLGLVSLSTSDLLPSGFAGNDSVPLAVAGLLVLGAIVVVAYRAVDAQCIRSREHLHQVLLSLDKRPRGLDVAFRNLMVPCHDNTWKIAVAEFVQHSHVVLMDLRGFSESREGCKFEVNFLLDVLPVERVVFLIDRSNDRELVGRLLANCWRELSVSSPNLGNPAPQAKLYAAGQEDEADVQGLLDLLVTVAGSTARRQAFG